MTENPLPPGDPHSEDLPQANNTADVDAQPAAIERLLELPAEHYLRLYAAHRAACEAATIARIPFMGKKAPLCYDRLAKATAILEVTACCGFGCPGDNNDAHILHRLLGRVVSNANASLDLAMGGYYDESLTLSRSIGEIANLLWLFQSDHSTLDAWKTLDGRARWNNFRPAAVRRKLVALNQVVLVDEDDYSVLSEVATHVSPGTSPQTLGVHRRPNLGGFFLEDAFIAALNELAWNTGVVCLPAGLLLLTDAPRKRVLQAGADLLAAVGGIRVSKLGEFWNAQETGA
jgi:hypothetical protein